jgi:hypothetical protein
MYYPSGFAKHVLWGTVLAVCFGLGAIFKGAGLALDWAILSALIYWHLLAAQDDKSPDE